MRAAPLNFTGVRQTDDTSRQVQSLVRASVECPLLDGVLLEIDPSTSSVGIAFTAGQVRTLAHGLGRRWRGFLVTSETGASASLLRATRAAATDSASITLTHGGAAACTVTLWVF